MNPVPNNYRDSVRNDFTGLATAAYKLHQPIPILYAKSLAIY